jgi:hypothetical protein
VFSCLHLDMRPKATTFRLEDDEEHPLAPDRTSFYRSFKERATQFIHNSFEYVLIPIVLLV